VVVKNLLAAGKVRATVSALAGGVVLAYTGHAVVNLPRLDA